MILRRITKHVTDQNWFAVFIDFLIVVVGVFIGIQVANWNSERQLIDQQVLVNQRLYNDFVLLEQVSNKSLSRTTRIIVSLETLKTAINRGFALKEEDEAIKFALRWGGSYSDNMRRSPTYVELYSSGQLNLIDDEDMRVALSRFNQEANSSEFNFRSLHNVMIKNYINLVKYSTLMPIDVNNSTIRLIDTYDIPAMANDESFTGFLDLYIDLQGWFYSNIESHNRALKETKSILKENR